MRVLSPRMLPPEIGLDGIHAQHRDVLAALADQVHAQRVDEGALADARHARDADAQRIAGVRQHGVQQARREFAVRRQVALDQRDGAGEHHAVAGQDAVDVALQRQRARQPAARAAEAGCRQELHSKSRQPDKLLYGTRTRSIKRVQDLLRAHRDHGARAEYARHARLVQAVVILRRNDAADDHQNVLAAELLQLRDHFRHQRLVPAGQAGDAEHVDVVLHRHAGGLARRLEQRTDVDVEAEVGEGGGDHLGAAVVAVLAHLGHQDARPAAFRARELLAPAPGPSGTPDRPGSPTNTRRRWCGSLPDTARTLSPARRRSRPAWRAAAPRCTASSSRLPEPVLRAHRSARPAPASTAPWSRVRANLGQPAKLRFAHRLVVHVAHVELLFRGRLVLVDADDGLACRNRSAPAAARRPLRCASSECRSRSPWSCRRAPSISWM